MQQSWYTNEPRTLLHKDRVSTGSHTYFFELKVAKSGSKYIVFEQRHKVGDEFVGSKMRIFEDEMLEVQRTFQKLVGMSLDGVFVPQESASGTTSAQANLPLGMPSELPAPSVSTSNLHPPFFQLLLYNGNWQQFEEYTHYLFKLLGIQSTYTYVQSEQAGRADGFFKYGNLAVLYDCTLRRDDVMTWKNEQVINYCNRLQQGQIEVAANAIEEFYTHQKQVWLITRGQSQRLQVVNNIEVKEVAIQDIITIYDKRLASPITDHELEDLLRNIGR
ncbi:MAG: hypothetical protein AAF639_47245 [Chloroflexota bacterium]